MVHHLKSFRDHLHNLCRLYVNKEVRVETIDGHVYEGTIVNYDKGHLYLSVSNPNRVYTPSIMPLVLYDLLVISLSYRDQPQRNPSNISGKWETYFGANTKSIIEFTQQGNTVTGTYSFDSKNGKIQGSLFGNTLRGEWSQVPSYQYPNDRGQLVFDFTPPNVEQPFDFEGYWSYGTEEPKHTPEFLWKGRKIGSILGVPMPEFGRM
jgi:hypothetical protein